MRRFDWNSLLLWSTGLVLSFLALGWVMRHESTFQLEREAEQSSLRLANLISRAVPDLNDVFRDGALTTAAREQLLQLGIDHEVFRFKLFDRSGGLILLSDDMNKPNLPQYDRSKEGIGEHDGGGNKDHIRNQVLSGTPYVELKREVRPDRPAIYSEAYVPILKEGHILGIVEVYVDQADRAARNTQSFLRVVSAVAVSLLLIVIAAGYQFWRHLRIQRSVEEHVRYLAHHDILSGALNRASFSEALAQETLRQVDGGSAFSLLFIDLDHFKSVNDSLGHAAGDEVLRIATQRLKACVREGDEVARLGGDEFAILLKGLCTTGGVAPLARRIIRTLAAPYEINDQRVLCGASIGIAIQGVDATEPSALMHKADLALYRAKSDGRGTYSFYDITMDQQVQAKRKLASDLRHAIAADQLSLHYQALHGSDGETLIGYEALLRWQHPDLGNVPPNDFIPLAEETGLIHGLGLWVLRRACSDAAGWPPSLTVSVNLSVAQLASGNLVEIVTQSLVKSGLEAERLDLEITESMLMGNSEQIMDTLRELAEMGVSISMDDFGTGYSSLAYLWRFPFNKVKIDKAFTQNLVQDPKVSMIVRSIITLAHSLDIRVNAEGVETHSQLATLQDLGCDEMQGFLLGRPVAEKLLTHIGHYEGGSVAPRRSESRGSLFATLPMELPAVHPSADRPKL